MHRLLLAFILALPAFPVDKYILQLQRDMAQLQDQVRTLQKAVDERMTVSQQLLSQNLEAIGKLSNSLTTVEKTIQGQEKVLVAPVANVSTRVDTLASQFQSLRDSVEEVNSKLSKLQLQVVDVKTIVTSLPPPAAQPAQPAAPQVSAETLFKNASKDFQAGNYNLAGPQFADYIKFFGSTDQAADAQYYLGEIFYTQQQYDQAAQAFNQVLERYPESKVSPDAQYKKGMSMLKQGKSDDAARDFREVIKKAPRSDAAAQAREALAGLGLRATPAKPGRK